MEKLPKWIYINGITYHFKEWEGTHNKETPLHDFYFCGLFDEKDWPAEVTGKDNSFYFLCAAELSKEESYKRLLEKINNMK